MGYMIVQQSPKVPICIVHLIEARTYKKNIYAWASVGTVDQ